MYGLDLFSGIGGITKALESYVTPVAYCEIDRYARGVLLSRMADGELPTAPIWDDVTTLKGSMLPKIDIVYGGFPCQDISIAGNHWEHCGKGLEGKRSGLFYQICRLAKETEASLIFLENVPAIRTRGLGRVVKELDSIGYDCRWGMLRASDIGARHKRKRWFLLAYSRSKRLSGLQFKAKPEESRDYNEARFTWSLCNSDTPIPDTIYTRIIRMADGIPFGVDRVKSLGNAVVPYQAKEAFERLLGLKGE
jgi:DNA (cytosine-5)-methyltransferase 1